MLLLGFSDDVLNLRWRYKLVLPFFASLPLVIAYSGITEIVLPRPLRPLFGSTLELGLLYHMYMMLVTIFCTNAINIYAGINGLEISQSLVIASAALMHNFVVRLRQELSSNVSETIYMQHLLSATMLIPFIFTSLGLLKYNMYPAKVFVGDTYCYFAGMTLATAGILGHYSKTLMLFFIPQILNFVVSIPQIFGLVECPRHRLPRYNPRADVLECEPGHHTLVNLALWLCGPLHEQTLCQILSLFQVFCCLLGFWVRYSLSHYFY